MDLVFIEPTELAQKMLNEDVCSMVIFDVRDEDREGGHIKGSVHLPSSTLDDSALDEAIHQHVSANSQVQSVVVHCMFSQQRGPRAALRIQERLQKADSSVKVMVVKGGWQGFARAVGNVHPELLDGHE